MIARVWRPRASLLTAGLALGAGAALLVRFPPEQYAFYPVCPFHAVTGWLCPGCGATRAVAALLQGDLAGAWRLNGLVMMLIPLVLGWAARVVPQVWRGDEVSWPQIPGAVWGVVGVATAGFGVMRNLG